MLETTNILGRNQLYWTTLLKPPLSLETPSFELETPSFHRRPQIFIKDPSEFHWRPQIFQGEIFLKKPYLKQLRF